MNWLNFRAETRLGYKIEEKLIAKSLTQAFSIVQSGRFINRSTFTSRRITIGIIIIQLYISW